MWKIYTRNFEQVKKTVHDIIIDPSYNIAPSQQALVIKEDEALDFIDWSFHHFGQRSHLI